MKNIFYITFLSIFISSCGPNALSSLGSQTSDEYYFEEATKANNNQAYDYALEILLTKLSASGQASVAGKELLASAYAGKCGFNFVEYVAALADSSSGTAFGVVMAPFVGVEIEPEFCLSALQTMDTLGAPGVRTANQNTFSAITGLVLMGASLRAAADNAPANGDGTMDTVDQICNAGLVTDDQMNEIIVGYGYFVTNLTYVSAAMLGSSSFDSLNDSVTLCNSLPGADCDVTDPDNVSNDTRTAIRALLNTVEYGIGDAVTGGDPFLVGAACL